jgi:hypothetical protein
VIGSSCDARRAAQPRDAAGRYAIVIEKAETTTRPMFRIYQGVSQRARPSKRPKPKYVKLLSFIWKACAKMGFLFHLPQAVSSTSKLRHSPALNLP